MSVAQVPSRQGATVWVLRSRSAGRPAVYNVLVETADDPVVVGREMPLWSCRLLVRRLDAVLGALRIVGQPYLGDRRTALRVKRLLASSAARIPLASPRMPSAKEFCIASPICGSVR